MDTDGEERRVCVSISISISGWV